MESSSALLPRIADRSARIAVLGLGSVGLPLAAAFVRAGFRVLGFDVDQAKIEKLGAGEAYLSHLDAEVMKALQSELFEPTSDPTRLGETNVKIICVPTPLGEYREPDLSYIEGASDLIAATLSAGDLVVLESTTYPSTTRTVVAPILERGGLVAGRDFDTTTIPKLVGGVDPKSGEVAAALYACAVETALQVSTAEVAEAAKLLENIFRAVNIALVNELKVVLDAMDIDVWEVIEAAATKPFGFMKFTPGPGMGGHCIPIDPFYLSWIARKVGQGSKFIELAGEINRRMPAYVIERTQEALNGRGKALKDARILILGLAFKPDVDIVTESPSIALVSILNRFGARVDYSDPCVATGPREMPECLQGRASTELNAETLAGYDAVILATHHSAFDYPMIAEHAPLVVDTRNALAELMGGDPRYFKA